MNINGSWIQYIRRALRMSQKTLAEKALLTVSAVTQAEAREKEGKLNIKTMHKLANAMDCQFVYAIIPNQDLEDLVEAAISTKAESILKKVSTQMSLEDQKSSQDSAERLNSLKDDIRKNGKIW